MKIAVTGAKGFLGKELVSQLLHQSYDVISLTKQHGDLLSLSQTKAIFATYKIDLVIHCAAFVPKTIDEYNNASLAKNNDLITKNLIRSTSCPIIYMSSMTVYNASTTAINEDAPKCPSSAYARSKLRGERYIKASKRNALIIRLPGLFGINRKSGLIYNNLKQLSQSISLQLPEKPLIWAAMDVKDAAQSIILLINNITLNGVNCINISYPQTYSINKLVDIYNTLFNANINYTVQHPEFSYSLTQLTKAKAVPKNTLFNAIKNLKGQLC